MASWRRRRARLDARRKVDRLQRRRARREAPTRGAALLDGAGRRRRRDADAAAARVSGQDLARRTPRRVSHEQLVGRRASQLSRRPESSDLDRRPQDVRSRDDAERHDGSRRRAGGLAARLVALLGAADSPSRRTWIRSGSSNDVVDFISDRDGVAERLELRHQVEEARRSSRTSPTTT